MLRRWSLYCLQFRTLTKSEQSSPMEHQLLVGKNGGYAAKLKHLCGTEIINKHYICHRLALAYTDTLKDPVAAGRVNKMHLNLLQLWKYFENSPKEDRCLKVQLDLKKKGSRQLRSTKPVRFDGYLLTGLFLLHSRICSAFSSTSASCVTMQQKIDF